MLQAMIVTFTAVAMAVYLPLMVFSPAVETVPDDRLLIVEQEKVVTDNINITIESGKQMLTIPLEEYLVGVVLAEMPASFSPEALKAQAVAARTFAVRQLSAGKHTAGDVCDQSACCQAWISEKGLMTQLGENAEIYIGKAKKAVAETKHQILVYRGNPIEALYFSCSGGRTEDAAAVWGSEVPYLQSVTSKGEEAAPKYYSEMKVTFRDFKEKLPDAKLEGNPTSWFGTVDRTVGGGISTVLIGGHPYVGTELRTIFGLNSTNFEISIAEDGIIFEVWGYGHRVGMSQYGAEAMAKNGNNYMDILSYYYPGTELQ